MARLYFLLRQNVSIEGTAVDVLVQNQLNNNALSDILEF
jgi:hypothetical protein